MTTVVFKDFEAFVSRTDRDVNGVSPGFALAYPDYLTWDQSNIACWNCVQCHFCTGCTDCLQCQMCRTCSNCLYCISCADCYKLSHKDYYKSNSLETSLISQKIKQGPEPSWVRSLRLQKFSDQKSFSAPSESYPQSSDGDTLDWFAAAVIADNLMNDE